MFKGLWDVAFFYYCSGCWISVRLMNRFSRFVSNFDFFENI